MPKNLVFQAVYFLLPERKHIVPSPLSVLIFWHMRSLFEFTAGYIER